MRKLSENIFDMSFGGVPAMLKFIDQGRAIHILAPSNGEGAGFVARNELNIRSWSEFLAYVKESERPFRVGYKIAVSVQNLIFEAALRSENISFSTNLEDEDVMVTMVNLHGAKNLIPALEDKLIDGFVVNQPFVSMAEESDSASLVSMLQTLPPDGQWQGSPCCALAANDSFVQNSPELAQAMTTLMLFANKRISSTPQESAKQVAKWLEISPAVESRSMPTIKFTIDFDEDWNRGVDFWVKSMIDGGKLNGNVKHAFQEGRLHNLIYDWQLYTASREKVD